MLTQCLPVQLQDGLFNALELCAYFLGRDYAPLEGAGEAFALSDGPNAWFLVGPDPITATVRLS